MASPVSVKNSSSFIAKRFPYSVGHVYKDTKNFTWNIKKWSDLGKKASSPIFECGGHQWYIRVYTSDDDKDSPDNVYASAFLHHAGPDSLPKGWNVCVHYAIVFSNPENPTIHTVKVVDNRRFDSDMGWGVGKFAKLTMLHSIQKGHTLPIIQDDAVEVTIFLRVFDDIQLEPATENSTKKIGYVGLKKKGATSYMNAWIQVLFSIRSFRKAVFETPIEKRNASQCPTFALQRIFYHLQTSDECVSTKDLRNSLNWDEMDAFLAGDIAKFRRLLRDVLLSTMQGTEVDEAIHELFYGQIETFVQCLNINQEHQIIDKFDEIQLEITGAKSLRDCFVNFTKTEMLTGKNKYITHNHGLQDAERGKSFRSFPPVLFLRLKRWHYNPEDDTMMKINDRLGFPFSIDLDEFLSDEADCSQPSLYQLHAVLVHSGDLVAGHNYALIKPDKDEEWLRFDDDCVTKATENDVLGTYGTCGDDPGDDDLASAYMLVYIRKSSYDKLMVPCDDEDIPDHIEIGRFPANEVSKIQDDATVKVITDETFTVHKGFDMAAFDDGIEFHVPKAEKYSALKERIATHFRYRSETEFRVWTLVAGEKKTVRPGFRISEDEDNLNVETICKTNNLKPQNELRLYVEDIPTPIQKTNLPSDSVVLFLKHFDALKQTICGVNKIYVFKDTLVGNLTPAISALIGWMVGTPVMIYKEVKPGTVELLESTATVDQSDLASGDILCFQVDLTDREIEDLEQQGLCTDAVQYYDFLQNHISITFRPKFGEVDSESAEFNLSLGKNQNYDVMSKRVGTRIDHDSHKIRFTRMGPNGSRVTLNSSKKSISELMGYISKPEVPLVILYEKLDVDVSLAELEVKRNLEITWVNHNNKKASTYSVLSAKTSMVYDLSLQLAEIAPVPSSDTPRIRIYEISKDRKLQKEYCDMEMVENIPESAELFAEEILEEEVDVIVSQRTIGVFHFTKELSQTHGIPFKFVAQEGELFEETKKRIQSRLSISDDEFANYRFALMKPTAPLHPSYLEDDDIIYDCWPGLLGLDHDVGEESQSTSDFLLVPLNISLDTPMEDVEETA